MAFLSSKSRKLYLLFFLGFIISIQLYTLEMLDYSTSYINWFLINEEINVPPPNDKFHIGNLEWNIKMYSESPDFEPFRQYFHIHCAGLKGVSAASCLSKNFIKTIPFGAPSEEIFEREYSPAMSFEKGLKGSPGHCVTYSTYTVNTLLSVGIPARFVQVFFEDKAGHNVVEVWDEEKGWVFFDPLNNGVLSKNGREISALEAVSSEEKLELLDADTKTAARGYLTGSYNYAQERLFKNYVIYPEPWLYTRMGEKKSYFFRGSFAAFGDKSYLLGPLQNLLRFGIIFSSFIGVIIFVSLVKPFLKS